MAHMMARKEIPGFTGAMQDLTPEQTEFLQRLMGGQQGGPEGAAAPFLGGPAGDLFLDQSPETPPLPDMPIPVIPPEDTFPPDVERPEDDDTPIDTPIPPTPEDDGTPIDTPETNDRDGDGYPDDVDYYPDDPTRWQPPRPSPEPPTDGGDPYQYPYPYPYPQPYPVSDGYGGGQTQDQYQYAGGGTATGGDAVGIAEGGFAPVFNIGFPGRQVVQGAVDVTMDAYDRYQQALLDKYYADTLRDLGMAALGGGSGGGGDVVGPVGYSNLVTGALSRYQQPKPIVKKERHTSPKPNPKNPTPWPGPVPTPPSPPSGIPGVAQTAMAGAPAAEGEPGDFDAGQFLSEVQAGAAGDVQGESFLPPIPPREDDWKDRDTKKFLEKMNEPPGPGSGPMVDPGLQPGKLTVGHQRALDSLLQRPPEVKKPEPIYDFARHAPSQRPPFFGKPPAAPSGIDQQFADIMGGAGAPLGGKLAGQIEQQGQAEEFENLATANRRGLEMAQAVTGFKKSGEALRQEQDRFRQQKAQDIMANLASKRGQRGGGTRTSVRMRT